MSESSWVPIVQDIVERERRTLLQFAGEAYPWASVREEPALAQLRSVIEQEQRGAVRLAMLLERNHIAVPPPEPFPLSYAAFNFVSLDYLLPQLIEHQRLDIAQLERDLARLEDPNAWQQVESLLQMKRRHLKTLEELASQASKAVHA